MTLCTIFKTHYPWVWDCVNLVFCQLSELVVWLLKSNNYGSHKLRGISQTIGKKCEFLSFWNHPLGFFVVVLFLFF